MGINLDEAIGQVARRQKVQPTFGYYRQPNGWITVSPMTLMEELKYRRRGWEPLPQYGRFDMSTEYAANHPLETLFMLGGAHELPLEQVVQQGLYLNPLRVPACGEPFTQFHKKHEPECWQNAQIVVFPQLEGATGLGPFDCRFCERDFATEPGRSQHEVVAHKAEKGEIRTGETLAQALLIGLGASQNNVLTAPASTPVPPSGDTSFLQDQLAMMRREIETLKAAASAATAKQRHTVTCEQCGWSSSSTERRYAESAKRMHLKAKHPEEVAVPA